MPRKEVLRFRLLLGPGIFVLTMTLSTIGVHGRADAPPSPPADPFAKEPMRPKADAPVHFSTSLDAARAEAKRTGRRILVYFTGDHCGWCRVLENRTFTDAKVVELSKQFVCVELNVERDTRSADEFGIESIPRSIVLTAEAGVIDRRTGYLPAADYATWLEAALTGPPPRTTAHGSPPKAPPVAGAAESEADLVIWFVDASKSVTRWGDGDWIGHRQLLQVLRGAGVRPRIEHVAREQLPDRWERALAAGRLPQLITADAMAGLILGLQRDGKLIVVSSARLASRPEAASCHDFARRFLFLVTGTKNEQAGRRAVSALLKPSPGTSLPGAGLSEDAGRTEAVAVSRRAVAAFFSGDVVKLKEVASSSSPQLGLCTKPPGFLRGAKVDTESVEVRGNAAVAFARVEMRLRGDRVIEAEAIPVVLRREGTRWKAFTVGSDDDSTPELLALCVLGLRPQPGAAVPPKPILIFPPDGGGFETGGRSFAWRVTSGGEPLAAQICQVLLDEKEGGWPMTAWKVWPGEPRVRSVPISETSEHLTGVSAAEMRWCVWALGGDGQLSVSEVRNYKMPVFNP